MPERIQLRRTKGWRMPPNTVKVDRTTRWGNLYRVGLAQCGCRAAGECAHNIFRTETAAEAVEAYAAMPRTMKFVEEARIALGGKNLACWCKPGEPCHADVLLRLANETEGLSK